jgi:hypothetical protein
MIELMQIATQWDNSSSVHQLPAAVHRAATSFPVSCLTPIEGLRDQIVRFLPDHEVALRLVDNFYDVLGLVQVFSIYTSRSDPNSTSAASSLRGPS